jgi:hypothetical protein
MKKSSAVFTLIALLSIMSACQGPKGETGPSGASGTLFEKEFQYGLLPNIYYSNSYDSKINNGASYINNNYGSCDEMSVGNVAGNKVRSLVRFNLNTMEPSGAKVKKAYLTLNVANVVNSVTITAYALNETWFWSEGSGSCTGSSTGDVSWNDLLTPGGTFNLSAPVSTSAVKQDGKTDTYDPARFELNAAMVQGWISNPSGNYGIILVASDENAAGSYISFQTKNSLLDYSFGPKLTVYYELP